MTRALRARAQNELFGLPVAPDQGLVLGRVVELPPPLTVLPREKPLPKPRPPTRWEEYAKTKGIVKRKRSARVWDEDAGEWRGRHGYKRAGDPNEVPVIEAKAWEQTGAEDPFSMGAREKKARVESQKGRQVANLAAAAKRGGSAALQPGKATLSSLLPLDNAGAKGAPLGARLGADSLKRSAAMARLSTASMGARPRAVATIRSVCLLHRRVRALCSPRRARLRSTEALRACGRPSSEVVRCGAPLGARLRVNAEDHRARGRRRPPFEDGGPPARGNADSFALGTRRRRSDLLGQTLRLTDLPPFLPA